jgi:DNA-binding GntR family transcriptional regulator
MNNTQEVLGPSSMHLGRPPSLAAIVTERIRNAIMNAEFKLGEALSEESLATTFGVSRTPVREALTALQVQGLIEIFPQRGSFVFLPSVSDLSELSDFRELIETQALELCYSHNPTGTIAGLRAACDAMAEAARREDHLAFAREDGAFHTTFIENCGNRYLIESYKLISGRIAAMRANQLSSGGRPRSTLMEEHDAISDAFSAGNIRRAKQLISAHILAMPESYGAALASKKQTVLRRSRRRSTAVFSGEQALGVSTDESEGTK